MMPTTFKDKENDSNALVASTTAGSRSNKKRILEQHLQTHQQPSWETFVRQGARLKVLFGDAMTQARHLTEKEEETDDIVAAQHQFAAPFDMSQATLAADLAREKTAEVLSLQRQLAEAQAKVSATEASNLAIREELAATQARLDRTVNSLRTAGSNAAKARSEADAYEATASSLAQTLQSLQSVVEETKRASQVLHQEQQQLASEANKLQELLLHKESELARIRHELKTARQSKMTLEQSNLKIKHEKFELDRQLTRVEQEADELRRTLSERQALEDARKQRANKLEAEWRQAQSFLVAATAGRKQSEQTQALLEESIQELKTVNENLHQQLKQQQDQSRTEKERLSEALTKAEKQVQTLRIQNEATEEELARVRLDKTAADKMIAQLKSRVATLERQVKDLPAEEAFASLQTPRAPSTTTGITFHLPPLHGNSSSISPSPVPKGHCSICFKAPMGLMKACQCGGKCDKKAHATCISKIQPGVSVSHPGTPAPQLPLILCKDKSV